MSLRRKTETFEPVTMGHIRSHGCRTIKVYLTNHLPLCIFQMCFGGLIFVGNCHNVVFPRAVIATRSVPSGISVTMAITLA